MMSTKGKKVVLMIMDGVGLRAEAAGNAVASATLPTIDRLLKEYPAFSMQAAGGAVGMNDTAPGSSEPGHLTIGTGQIIDHPIRVTSQEITEGRFAQNAAVAEAITYAKHRSSKVHLVGILSDVDVQACAAILPALIDMVKSLGYVNKLYLHLILDGRDTEQRSGQSLVEQLYLHLRNQGYGSIATMIGRDLALSRVDTDKKVTTTLDLLLKGKGETAQSPLQAIIDAYGRGETDEFLQPIVVDPAGLIEANDAVIFYNERADRMRPLFEGVVAAGLRDLFLVAYAPYFQPFTWATMYQPPLIEPNLVSTITSAGRSVHKITETERYAHLTYFFNGRREDPYEHEIRTFIDSAPEHALPKMIATLTQAVLTSMHDGEDCIIVNYPYGDRFGHAGDFEGAVAALGLMDAALGEIVAAAGETYAVICTADHGNCEYLRDAQADAPRKEDTTNPVWSIVVDSDHPQKSETTYASLAATPPTALLPDVAATILTLMGIPVPPELTGLSLLT